MVGSLRSVVWTHGPGDSFIVVGANGVAMRKQQFEQFKAHDLYGLLEVSPKTSFGDLKKAFYRRAKECHPDLHPNDPAKEEEFKLLVTAFDILSDPAKREQYDEYLAMAHSLAPGDRPSAFSAAPAPADRVMDTLADDILEEIIVGNRMPPGATLATMMLDLERTAKFVRFREAKTLFYQGRLPQALVLFQEAVDDSPGNILYHCFLARTAARCGQPGLAAAHYRRCLDLGAVRVPAQYLQIVRDELAELQRTKTALGRFFGQSPELGPGVTDAADQLREQVSRSIAKLLRKGRGPRAAGKLLGPRAEEGDQRLLGPGRPPPRSPPRPPRLPPPRPPPTNATGAR